jgi:hypothetical protein
MAIRSHRCDAIEFASAYYVIECLFWFGSFLARPIGGF